jgi:pre-rRNA-processing protein TSR1
MMKQLGTKRGPPKIFGVLPASESADPHEFIEHLNFQPLEEDWITEPNSNIIPTGIIEQGQFVHKVIPLAFATDESERLNTILDIHGIVDVVVLLFANGEPLSEQAKADISILKALGMPTTMAVVFSSNGEAIPKTLLAEYRKLIAADIPDLTRVVPVASDEDAGQFIRFLSVTSPRDISWKQNRPGFLVQNYVIDDAAKRVTVQGYVRNAPLNVNQIVSIPNVGDFQILTANGIHPNPAQLHEFIYTQSGPTDEINEEIRPPQTVVVPDPIEPLHMADYQQPLNEEEDNGEEEDGFDGEFAMEDEDDEQDDQMDDGIWERTQEELEFPDELQYGQDEILRQRLIKYRALKSFRKSPWNPNENLPPHYAKLFEFPAFARTSEAAIAEQLEGEIPPGSFVTIVLVTANETEAFQRIPEGRFISLFGLFRHETRFTVLNCTFKNELDEPLRSKKDDLLMVCGFRHLYVRPLYSEDDRADKHKYIRVLGKNEACIASFVAPAVMQSAPVAFFRLTEDGIVFTGSGSVKTVDPSRMIIKTCVLTGNPYRANGKTARVSMMFFNKEDIEWFRTVPLETKNGHTHGHITSTVGTKGHFKALFNNKVDQADTVYMNLYKRVFPPLDEDEVENEDGEKRPPAPTPALF